MRSYLTSVLMLSVLCFSGCNADSVTPQKLPDPSIVGLWKGVNISFTGTNMSYLDSPDEPLNIISLGYDEDFAFDFQENPNRFIADGSYGFMTTVSDFECSEDYMTPNNLFETDSFWTKSGDLLTIQFLGETTVFTIDVLTEVNLVFSAIVPFEQLMLPLDLQGEVLLSIEFERM